MQEIQGWGASCRIKTLGDGLMAMCGHGCLRTVYVRPLKTADFHDANFVVPGGRMSLWPHGAPQATINLPSWRFSVFSDPWNIYSNVITQWLCLCMVALLWYGSIRFTHFIQGSLALEKPCDCPSASETINPEEYGQIHHMDPLRTDDISTRPCHVIFHGI